MMLLTKILYMDFRHDSCKNNKQRYRLMMRLSCSLEKESIESFKGLFVSSLAEPMFYVSNVYEFLS